MSTILVAYATMAGSTADVAQVVAEELIKNGMQAEVLPLSQVSNFSAYDAIVVGAPMIMGWHRSALRFLKKHRKTLIYKPLAIFITAISLTDTGESNTGGTPIYIDQKLPKPAQKEGSLSFRERYTRLSSYLRPVLRAARPAKPVSVGVFGGRLEYGRLKWWAVLFAMLVIQATPGDRRNWTAIRDWAAELPAVFQLAPGNELGA
jgi:menaquinone-dependent protoporphyrinogen IX oxidase